MGFLNNGRVNIVITNRVLRYSYNKNTSTNGLITHGEAELPADTIKDGAIANRTVLLEILNRLIHENKWKRKKLYFSVPDDTVVIRQLQIPVSLTKEESISYIKMQIGTSFYLPFSNPAIAVEYLEADGVNRNILLFAYPKEKLIAFEQVFEEAGLKPIAADLTSLSLYRYYYQTKQDEKDHVLLIHWNQDAIILTAFQNHKAIFTRYMKISAGENLSEESARQMINEYIIEINRIIDFYQYSITKGVARISQLLVSGDFPFLPAARSSLSEAVTLPIHDFKSEELPVKYMDVLGLALKAEV